MAIELADIMRRFGPLYLKRFSGSMLASHKRAISDIQQCRTEAMGGHLYRCDGCGKKVYVYHACRNRHCPACHRDQIYKWLEQRTAELLPCDYFHVTVTIPETLRRVFRSNQKRMYFLLMKTASESLIQLADDPRHLGGRIGILAVLHTWTSNLTCHPHVHMLVTGGGVHDDGQWMSCKHQYLVSVNLYHLPQFLLANKIPRQAKYIRIIMCSRNPRGKFIMAQNSPDTLNLICCHTHSHPR
jgi:hypothetical protein